MNNTRLSGTQTRRVEDSIIIIIHLLALFVGLITLEPLRNLATTNPITALSLFVVTLFLMLNSSTNIINRIK